MSKRAIVFDVDGVISDSGNQKDTIIEQVLNRNGLLHLSGVREILDAGLNRVLMLEKIYEIQKFDKNFVLEDINVSLRELESNLILIQQTQKFIEMYHDDYDFFTNTSMPKSKLLRIFEAHSLQKYFVELLAYEDGSKKENIEYIIQVYGYNPSDILFIDDKQVHIEAVKPTGIHTLLFDQDCVNLDESVKDIFSTDL